MRQLDRDELIYTLAATLRTITPATWKLITDHRPDAKAKGRAIVAGVLADGLGRFEVLSSAPPAPAGTFERPVARMLGEAVETGAIRLD